MPLASLPSLAATATAAVLRSLPVLLHLYWLLAAGAVLFTLLPWDVAPGFKAAVRLSAARGKTMEPTSSSKSPSQAAAAPTKKKGNRSSSRSRKGPSSSSSPSPSSPSSSSPLGPFLTGLTVPQGWFLHFYALGSVSATAVLVAALRGGGRGASSPSLSPLPLLLPLPPSPPSSVAALCLLLLHVARRWAECAWQAKWPQGARMHFIAYAFGMTYYAVLPLSLLPPRAFSAAADALVAGAGRRGAVGGAGGAFARGLFSRLGLFPSSPAPLKRTASLVKDAFASLPLFPRLLGVAVFAAGTALQASSHVALARLQREAAAAGKEYLPPPSSFSSKGNRGKTRSKSVLSLCTCPHYLGEIVIYLGLAMVAAGGLGGGRRRSGGELSSPSAAAASSASSSAAGVLPLLALVWVTVNLVLASRETKRWYRSRFPREFPEERAALIPGVF